MCLDRISERYLFVFDISREKTSTKETTCCEEINLHEISGLKTRTKVHNLFKVF